MGQRGEREAQRLEAAIERLLSEAATWQEVELYRSPAEGEWTAMKVLAHLAEMQPYWAHQLERVVAAPGQPFGRTMEDPERIAAVEDHAQDALEPMLARLRAATAEATSILRSLDDSAWTSTGIHSRRGEMDLGAIVEFFLVGHAEEHVEQAIRAVRG